MNHTRHPDAHRGWTPEVLFHPSTQFPSFEARELVTGLYGRRQKQIVPYDPFKFDVRSVGEMARKEFLVVAICSFRVLALATYHV
jgi:hypothetical protein